MKNLYLAKRMLQIVVVFAVFVPLLAGLFGVLRGTAFVGDGVANISMESHFRYLSGVLLSIGVAFLATVPNIEYKTDRFRLLSMLIIGGGLARLYALIVVGEPNYGMMFGLVMELGIVPLLAVWQSRIAIKIK